MSRKKIIIAEMLYPKGHLTLNKRYIEVLSLSNDVTIIDDGKYFSSIKLPDNTKLINVMSWRPDVNRFIKIRRVLPVIKYDPIDFLAHLFNLIVISIRLLFYDYHKIIFMSVRNDVLSLALPLFKKDSVIAFHHYDIDHLQTHPREIPLFKRGMNKMNHIVLADFIKEGWLKQFNLDSSKIHVVYQPLVEYSENVSFSNVRRKPIVISLGLTIDEKILEEIIARDKEIKEKLSYRIILRHKELDYSGLNVSVIPGFFNRAVYNNYLETAAGCLVLYPQSYKLRYSGVIDDALGHAMNVYGNNIEAVKYFASRYPKSCWIINDINDLFNLTISEYGMDRQEYMTFVNNHCDKEIVKQFESVLK